MPSTKIISTNTTVHPTVPSKHLLQCSPLCWAIAKADDVLPTSYRKAVSHGEVWHMEVVGWCWEEMTFRFISQIHITPNMHPKLRIESTMQISYKLGKSWNHTTQFLRFSKKLSTKNPVRSDPNPDSRVSINCAWNWHASFCLFSKKIQGNQCPHWPSGIQWILLYAEMSCGHLQGTRTLLSPLLCG